MLHSRFTSDQTQYFLSIRFNFILELFNFYVSYKLHKKDTDYQTNINKNSWILIWTLENQLTIISDTSLKWGVLETSLNIPQYYTIRSNLYRKLVVGKILR